MARFLSVNVNLEENFTVVGLPDAEVCIGGQCRVAQAMRRSMRAFASGIMPAIGWW